MSYIAPAQIEPDLASYDHFIVAFSGGKDSMACLLHLIDLGVDPLKIELHHHEVDGGSPFMDWPITPAYCRAVATEIGIPIYFSWREGGFLREMLRDNTRTAPVYFETEDGVGKAGGVNGPLGTRKQFPQVSADLSVRWCSAYCKIDVLAAAIRNQDRFLGKRTLVITGERAQESTARARYATFERHRTDTRDGKARARHVDAWRPIHAWSEDHVWQVIRAYGVRPHPAYRLGFGRVSCASCIFGSPNQWATILAIAPEHFERIAVYEERFGKTIQRARSIRELAARGTPYAAALEQPDLVALAFSTKWTERILIGPENWAMPAGAFGENAGPT